MLHLMIETNEFAFPVSDTEIIGFFFKAFALLVSVFYLVYAIVLTRQTDELNKTLQHKSNEVLFIISSLQIPVAVALIFFAIFLL